MLMTTNEISSNQINKSLGYEQALIKVQLNLLIV